MVPIWLLAQLCTGMCGFWRNPPKRSELMASTVLTKPSTCVGRAARTRWRLAGQHRTGIHCSIAINGVRDGRQEADHAVDTSTDDIALFCADATCRFAVTAATNRP